MPYDSDEEADYSKMDLVRLRFILIFILTIFNNISANQPRTNLFSGFLCILLSLNFKQPFYCPCGFDSIGVLSMGGGGGGECGEVIGRTYQRESTDREDKHFQEGVAHMARNEPIFCSIKQLGVNC